MSALLLALLLSHGLGPTPVGITVRPGSNDELLVSTNFGGVISRDRGASWRLICEEAIGYGKGLRPAWWLQPGGAMFAGSYKGLFVARTGGCSWTNLADFDDTGCSDLRGQDGTLIAASAKFGVTNRIMRSTDDGLSWTATPEASAALFYTTVRIAPSNPQRVYAAGWWFDPVSSWLFRSDDNGQTFARADVSAALPAPGPLYVLAVHPLKPELIFVTVSRDDPATSWLLRSTDSGTTFTAVATSPVIFNSVSFGADPSTVYAASTSQLLRSTDEGLTFTALPAPIGDACVATRGAAVYACGWQEMDGWSVGQGTGGAFSSLLKWGGIAGPLSCPAGSTVKTLCEPLWPMLRATFPAEPDSGVPDAGTAAADGGAPVDAGLANDAGEADAGMEIDGGVVRPPTPKGCGCATAEAQLFLAALLLIVRRRTF